MAVRLKDIGQDLGVSAVTVSKALRNHPDIAKATRERILQRVKELNYRPNLTARSLVTGHSSLIGLVVPDLLHPFFSEIAKALSGALRQKNFFLIVSSSDGDPVLEQDEIEHMLAYRLDALVIASSQENPDSLRRVNEEGPPLILLDRYYSGFGCNFLGTNDYQIGVLATEHLLSTGRRRIAHIRGPENNVGNRRFEGYRDVLEKHRIVMPQGYVISPQANDTNGRIRGERAMKKLLALKLRPNAVFCFNDSIAMGAMASVLGAGLRIPKDVALIGCGNYHYDDALQVPLSSVDQSTNEIGKRTAKMILNLLRAEVPVRPRRVVLEPKLVIRTSSQTNK